MKISNYYTNPTVILDAETHQYINTTTNQVIELKSVTKLIEQLFPFPVNEIPQDILKVAIEKGVCVHDRLNSFITHNRILKCTHTFNSYPMKSHNNEFEWIKSKLIDLKKQNKIKEIYSEIALTNDKYNGSLDLLYLDNKNHWHLVDFKTTSNLNKEKEALQLKFYEDLLITNFDDINSIHSFEIYNSKNQAHYAFDNDEQELAALQKQQILTELDLI